MNIGFTNITKLIIYFIQFLNLFGVLSKLFDLNFD